MATRRHAREWALQILFELDLNPRKDIGDVFGWFWREHKGDDRARSFTESLVRGIRERLVEIDRLIQKCAKNWKLARIGGVERNVLRMGIYELLNGGDVPPAVAINEAVDIAKYFGTSESGRFVNGILDQARRVMAKDVGESASGQEAEVQVGAP